MEPYYNITYGAGMEGVLNYVNSITNTWFANLFILFIFVVTIIVLSKSEWKMSNVLSFAFLMVFITTMIMRTFLEVSGYIMFLSIIGLAVTVFIGIASKNKF